MAATITASQATIDQSCRRSNAHGPQQTELARPFQDGQHQGVHDPGQPDHDGQPEQAVEQPQRRVDRRRRLVAQLPGAGDLHGGMVGDGPGDGGPGHLRGDAVPPSGQDHGHAAAVGQRPVVGRDDQEVVQRQLLAGEVVQGRRVVDRPDGEDARPAGRPDRHRRPDRQAAGRGRLPADRDGTGGEVGQGTRGHLEGQDLGKLGGIDGGHAAVAAADGGRGAGEGRDRGQLGQRGQALGHPRAQQRLVHAGAGRLEPVVRPQGAVEPAGRRRLGAGGQGGQERDQRQADGQGQHGSGGAPGLAGGVAAGQRPDHARDAADRRPQQPRQRPRQRRAEGQRAEGDGDRAGHQGAALDRAGQGARDHQAGAGHAQHRPGQGAAPAQPARGHHLAAQGGHRRHPAGPARRAPGGQHRGADADHQGHGHGPGQDPDGAGHVGHRLVGGPEQRPEPGPQPDAGCHPGQGRCRPHDRGLEQHRAAPGSAAATQVDAAHEQAKVALAELRELIRGVHPQILSDRGLPAAVDDAAGRSPVRVATDVVLPRRLPPGVEVAAYFAVCEALANVAKHSRATRASVRGRLVDGLLVLEVRDDGVGGADPAGGSGLIGLADRVAVVDGRLLLSSPPGGPTLVRVEIPCGQPVPSG
jgi:hypothetical protein